MAEAASDNPHFFWNQEFAEERGVPQISIDYGFVSLAGEETQRTFIVMKARPSKVRAVRCVAGRGRADPRAVP